MNGFRVIWRALKYQPEAWTVYLLGKNFRESSLGMISSKPRCVGLPFRVVAYMRGFLRSVKSASAAGSRCPLDVLAFAETANQAAALDATIVQLKEEGLTVGLVAGNGAAETSAVFRTSRWRLANLGLLDVPKVLLLNCLRMPAIWLQLYCKDERLTRWHFDKFLWCHIYLVFFEKILRSAAPKMILVSNDHNTPNRCLIALARVRGIRTAYVQHASVSTLFPALAFDYSLLDGPVAADLYMECDSNKPASLPLPVKRYVFLTGQKKPVHSVRRSSPTTVGIAFNALDKPQDVIAVVLALTGQGHAVRVRWHPAMTVAAKEEISLCVSGIPSVELSDPLVEPIGEFLKRVGVLVAGNSSIHLEAAISRVVPVYFVMTDIGIRDYYGYVRNQVSIEATDMGELIQLIDDVINGGRVTDASAVQAYSATFGTEWEGQEGKLTAEIIRKLLSGIDPCECPGRPSLMRNTQSL